MSGQRYFDGFGSREDVLREFCDAGYDYEKREQRAIEPPDNFPTDEEILFAAYGTQEAYSGDATVVYRRDGKLWIVGGSHCSCNGLEGQWSPSETTPEALRAMLPAEGYAPSDYAEDAREALRAMAAGLSS